MDSLAPTDCVTHEPVDGVHVTQLVTGERTSVQHFHIEPGTSVPEHSHEHEQVGYVVRGTATFVRNDAAIDVISAGESFYLPSMETHGVENRGDEPLQGVDVFSPPRVDQDWRDP